MVGYRAVVVSVVDSSLFSNNRSEGQSVIELSNLLPDQPLTASFQLRTPVRPDHVLLQETCVYRLICLHVLSAGWRC